MTANFGTWVLSKATGYREANDREALCVSICMAIGSIISTVYLRIKFIRLMTKSISGYQLADVERTQRVFADIEVFKNKNKKTKKDARNLRTDLNTFMEWKAEKKWGFCIVG